MHHRANKRVREQLDAELDSYRSGTVAGAAPNAKSPAAAALKAPMRAPAAPLARPQWVRPATHSAVEMHAPVWPAGRLHGAPDARQLDAELDSYRSAMAGARTSGLARTAESPITAARAKATRVAPGKVGGKVVAKAAAAATASTCASGGREGGHASSAPASARPTPPPAAAAAAAAQPQPPAVSSKSARNANQKAGPAYQQRQQRRAEAGTTPSSCATPEAAPLATPPAAALAAPLPVRQASPQPAPVPAAPPRVLDMFLEAAKAALAGLAGKEAALCGVPASVKGALERQGTLLIHPSAMTERTAALVMPRAWLQVPPPHAMPFLHAACALMVPMVGWPGEGAHKPAESGTALAAEITMPPAADINLPPPAQATAPAPVRPPPPVEYGTAGSRGGGVASSVSSVGSATAAAAPPPSHTYVAGPTAGPRPLRRDGAENAVRRADASARRPPVKPTTAEPSNKPSAEPSAKAAAEASAMAAAETPLGKRHRPSAAHSASQLVADASADATRVLAQRMHAPVPWRTYPSASLPNGASTPGCLPSELAERGLATADAGTPANACSVDGASLGAPTLNPLAPAFVLPKPCLTPLNPLAPTFLPARPSGMADVHTQPIERVSAATDTAAARHAVGASVAAERADAFATCASAHTTQPISASGCRTVAAHPHACAPSPAASHVVRLNGSTAGVDGGAGMPRGGAAAHAAAAAAPNRRATATGLVFQALLRRGAEARARSAY